MKTSLVRLAFKEAVFDTSLATVINFPINFVLVALALKLELSAMATTVMLTSTFFTIAVIRKTYLRVYFQRKHYQ